jgi:hypothetical protein
LSLANSVTTPSRVVEILPPAVFAESLVAALRAIVEAARLPPPIQVDRKEAARLFSMSTATYDKYAERGLVPKMKAAGRVSIEALTRASWKLDGIEAASMAGDPGEKALLEWE